MSSSRDHRPYDSVKRVMDLAGATAGLVVLSPAIAVVAALVAVKLGPPILFVQERPGRRARLFPLYKFRSMLRSDPARGRTTDEQRLTRFGRVLRSTSLDELPSLWNVLRGDMSIVGPRPLLVEYLDKYTPEQARRHDVRPGITGLAQVSGRNTVDWDRRFALDIEYVERRSFLLDMRILALTARAVFLREGISAAGHVTMRKLGDEDA